MDLITSGKLEAIEPGPLRHDIHLAIRQPKESILKISNAVTIATLSTFGLVANAATIDRMNTATFGHYTQSYSPGGTFLVFSEADTYLLSDGTSWESGAGSVSPAYSTLASVVTSESSIIYTFNTPSSGVLFSNTDYNSGNHSSQGTLGLPTSLSIVAKAGATTGILSGYTKILSNTETWYGEPLFNFYSAPVGSYVYFQQTFTLEGSTFTPELFNSSFSYNESGFVDFTNVATVPESSKMLLLLIGLAALPCVTNKRKPS